MFKRRTPRTMWESFIEFFAPRSGWRRAINYMSHRVRRLPDTPHRIAVGVSSGAFVCFSPFFGLHFFYAAFVAWLFRGNIIAALLGTFLGNPITFPFIAASSYRTGLWVLGMQGEERGHVREAFSTAFSTIWKNLKSLFGYEYVGWSGFVDFLQSIVWPYFVGGSILGVFGALATYFISKPLIKAYQNRRKGRLSEKLKQLNSARAEQIDKSSSVRD